MIGLLAWLAAAAAAVVPLPPTAGIADYQLGGSYAAASDVTIVTRDRQEKSDPRRYSICYVNAFQSQPGTIGWWRKHHPSLLLEDAKGRLVSDPGWPGEVILDLRGASRRAELVRVVDGWFARCATDGYEAVEPDNLDSWTRSRGLLNRTQATAMARAMVTSAHRHGLAIAQKNTPELGTTVPFDFAVAEECEVYRECGAYTSGHGRRVIEIEYTDNGRTAFARACAARKGRISVLLRDRDVVPRGTRGYVSRTC